MYYMKYEIKKIAGVFRILIEGQTINIHGFTNVDAAMIYMKKQCTNAVLYKITYR
jgi:hypothetical protein